MDGYFQPRFLAERNEGRADIMRTCLREARLKVSSHGGAVAEGHPGLYARVYFGDFYVNARFHFGRDGGTRKRGGTEVGRDSQNYSRNTEGRLIELRVIRPSNQDAIVPASNLQRWRLINRISVRLSSRDTVCRAN